MGLKPNYEETGYSRGIHATTALISPPTGWELASRDEVSGSVPAGLLHVLGLSYFNYF